MWQKNMYQKRIDRKNKSQQDETQMKDIPITTLFMIESLDGKINSGNNDNLDVDRDWNKIDGVKEGLSQYYEIEKTTDWYSLNTGRVMAKIGVNKRKEMPKKIDCRFIIIDRKPHLNENGISYLCNWVDILFLVTDNQNHPAFKLAEEIDNLKILYYEKINLRFLLEDLKEEYKVDRITIQSGGTLNCELLRKNLIDYVNIVIAPLLVGGKDTATLMDGQAIENINELNKLRALELLECKVLEDSYIQVKYKVLK